MNLSWLGLGQMGSPMAARLLDAGHEVVVWNRTPERAHSLVEKGAHSAATPAEAVSSAEVVFTMLAHPDAVEGVLFGEHGVVTALGRGTLVDMSTVGPAAVRRMAERLRDGVDMADAPVLGSVPQATDGSLKVFVGARPEVFARLQPLLEQLGRPVHVGPVGAGAAMKLVANATLGTLMTSLGEALALADALGLDEGPVLDVLADSPIGATARSKRNRIESGEYPPNFSLELAAKDLRLVADAAQGRGVDARVAAAARAHFEAAAEKGFGDLDYSAVIAHVRGHDASAGPA